MPFFAKLRKKILVENMSYKDTVTWGSAHEESTRKAKVVEGTSTKQQDDSRVRKLEEQLNRLETRDRRDKRRRPTCTRASHPPGQTCGGLSCTECCVCKKPGHFKGAPICQSARTEEEENASGGKKKTL